MAKAVVHIQVQMNQWQKGAQAQTSQYTKQLKNQINELHRLSQVNQRTEFSSMRSMMKYMNQQTYYFQNNLVHAFRNPILSATESLKTLFSSSMISANAFSKSLTEVFKHSLTAKKLTSAMYKTAYTPEAEALFRTAIADAEKARGIALRALPGSIAGAGVTVGAGYLGMKSLMATGGLRIASEGVKQYAGLEQTLTTIKAITDAVGNNKEAIAAFKDLEAEIKRLGETTSWTQQQIAGAAEVLTRGGFSLNETLDSLSTVANVAKATGAPLDNIAQSMLTIIRTFNLDTTSAKRLGDMMVKTTASAALNIEQLGQAMIYAGSTANAAGRSVEDVFTEIAALANIGIRGSMQGTVMNNISVRAAGNKKAIALYEQLGVDPFANGGSGNLKNLVELAKEMRDAMDRLGWSPKQQLEAYHAAWGIYGQKGAALGQVDIEPLRKAIVDQSEGSAKKQAAMMDQTMNGLWAIAKSQVSSGFTEGGKMMAPFIESALQEWTKVMGPNLKDQIIDMFRGVTDNLSAEGVLNGFSSLADAATTLGKACLEAAKDVINFATWLNDPEKLKSLMNGEYTEAHREGINAAASADAINKGIVNQYADAADERDNALAELNAKIKELVDEGPEGGYALAIQRIEELKKLKEEGKIEEEEYLAELKKAEYRRDSTLKGANERLEEAKKNKDTISQRAAHDDIRAIGENLKASYSTVMDAQNKMVDAYQRAAYQYNSLSNARTAQIKEFRIKYGTYTSHPNSPIPVEISGEDWARAYAQEKDWSEENMWKHWGIKWVHPEEADEHLNHHSNGKGITQISYQQLHEAAATMSELADNLERDPNLKSYSMFNDDGTKSELNLPITNEYLDELIKGHTKVDPVTAAAMEDRTKEGENFLKNYFLGAGATMTDAKNAEFMKGMQASFDEMVNRFNNGSESEKTQVLIELLKKDWTGSFKQSSTDFNGVISAFKDLVYNGQSIRSTFAKEGDFASEVNFAKMLAVSAGVSWERVSEGADIGNKEDATYTYQELTNAFQALTEELARVKVAIEGETDATKRASLESYYSGLITSQSNLANAIIEQKNKEEEKNKSDDKVEKSNWTWERKAAQKKYNEVKDTDEYKQWFEKQNGEYNTALTNYLKGEGSLDKLLESMNNFVYQGTNMLGFVSLQGHTAYEQFGDNTTANQIAQNLATVVGGIQGLNYSQQVENGELAVLQQQRKTVDTSMRMANSELAALNEAARNGDANARAQIESATSEVLKLVEERNKIDERITDLQEKASKTDTGAKASADSNNYNQYRMSALWLSRGAGRDEKVKLLTTSNIYLSNILARVKKFKGAGYANAWKL